MGMLVTTDMTSDLVSDQAGQPNFLVVGIGASAGGIQALREFFQVVPADSGVAYVVILHLSPEHDSQLAQVLQGVASIPVSQVREKMLVEENHVYVIPPNQHLMMRDNHIDVSPNVQVEERRAPVDIFFRTLADSHRSQAVCVVLSGTGANGSMGLKRIKERGGAAFVQNPREAEFNEMPRNSIATNLVDEVLPVQEIPAKIIAYKNSLDTVKVPVLANEKPEVQQQALREIFTLLRMHTGHDFTNYKRPTLLRRIERRISVRNLSDLPAYAAFLKEHHDEIRALLKDLLISVTNFFRDKQAFEILERDILPRLIQGKTNEDHVRIWIAGCATGEEAYSIAMLCAEKIHNKIDAPRIQLFATDIDEASILHARDGYYSLNDAADVSPERLRQFFNTEGEGYRIRREIREMILFANHNFIKDPPFSHLDMVTCRNVLIYLNQIAQERVLETFHFALDPGGFLFLGSSESVDGTNDLYATFNREHHIFQSRSVTSRPYPVPESIPHLPALQPSQSVMELQKHRTQERFTYGDLHQKLLEQYAPPSLIVNQDYDIIHLSQSVGRYLQISGGEISQNVLKLIRPALRLDLRSAFYQAAQQKTAVEARNIKVNIENQVEALTIHVRPVTHIDDTARGFFLVIFEPVEQDENSTHILLTSDEPVARHLEEELIQVKGQLRTAVEHHEIQAEELKASNEELQAMNEELRSAAEELETSKEELQSINEELTTVNQELKVKIEEISLSSNNLQNLINSANIGTVFLDRSLRVNMFTPAAGEIFNLIPADYGRPISDITNRLDYTYLLEDAEAVLMKLHTIEREVKSNSGQIFLMRVLPYRTAEDRINGVVFTFINITARKQTEEDLRIHHYRLDTALETTNAGWADRNLVTGETTWNESAKRVIGFQTEDESKSMQGWYNRIHPDDRARVEAHAGRPAAESGDYTVEYRVVHGNGKIHHILDTGKIHSENGHTLSSTGLVLDISDRKQNEEQLQESQKRLSLDLADTRQLQHLSSLMIQENDIISLYQKILESTIQLIHSEMGSLHMLLPGNTGLQVLSSKGFAMESAVSLDRLQINLFRSNTGTLQSGKRLIVTDINAEKSIKFTEDYETCVDLSIKALQTTPLISRNGHLVGLISTYWSTPYQPTERELRLLDLLARQAADLIERKKAEESLRISEERYRVALQSAEMGAWDWDIISDKVIWNDQHFIMLGLEPGDHNLNSAYFLNFIHPLDKDMISRKLLNSIETNEVYFAEFRIINAANGLERWMNGYGRVVSHKDGHASRMLGVIIDVTERKALEQQKDEFIGIASHELKTPLTSIKAYVELLQDMFTDAADGQSAELMHKLDIQVDRLTYLVRDLLDTTKISEGQLPLYPEKFDLNNLITERMEDLQRLTQKHRLILQAGHLPSLMADHERIGQVITNLITNAIKYSPNGGEIIIRSTDTGDNISVSVSDQGIGISEDMQRRVFDRFFRVSNPSFNTYPGMGLGLYITAGIIHRHGGKVSVDTKLHEGSTFTFILPYVYQTDNHMNR